MMPDPWLAASRAEPGNGVTYRKHSAAHPKRDFGPMEAHPELVQEVLVLARRAGIIPEDWVADVRAPAALDGGPYDADAEDTAGLVLDVVRNARRDFRLDPQTGQDPYIEIVCEAEGLMPRVARVAAGYGVPVYSGAGFDGLKGKRAFAGRAGNRDVPTAVLQIGDYDPHGLRIFTACAEDATAWACDPDSLRFERIAVTLDQAVEYGILDEDGKAEAEALPVPALDAIVTGAIESLSDPACREALRVCQEEERGRINGLIRDGLNDLGL